MNAIAKAEALAAKALNISVQRKEAAKQDKAPDIAKFMVEMNQVFGKPKAIRVDHNG